MRFCMFFLLFAMLCSTQSLLASPPLSCKQALRAGSTHEQEVLEKMHMALNSPGVLNEIGYIEGKCQSNVIRLFKYLSEKITDIDKKDFRVFYITTFTRFSPRAEGFGVRHPRVPFEADEFLLHHVVLEYKGYVIDLDFALSLGPVPESKYFRFQFEDLFFNYVEIVSSSALLVYDIPGESYLSISESDINFTEVQEAQISDLTPELLVDFY